MFFMVGLTVKRVKINSFTRNSQTILYHCGI